MGNIIADLIVKVRGEGSDAIKEMDRVERRFDGLARGMQRAGGMIRNVLSTAFGFVLGNAINAISRSFGQAVKAAIDFGRQMANVNSIAQLSVQEINAVSDAVINLSKDPRIADTPNVLAAGLYNIYSSGFQGAEALVVLEASAIAATAGLTTTDVAAKAITATMNAYGQETYSAAQVSDVLFRTVDTGVITFEELAGALGRTLPLANTLGVGIEQLGAAYAALTLKGLSSSEAETGIAAILRTALQPTEELTAAVHAYGYETAAMLLQAEGLPGYLKAVMEGAGGSEEALGKIIPESRALNAVLSLTEDGLVGYNEQVAIMNKEVIEGGATQAALAQQMKSAAFQFDQVKKQIVILMTTGFRILEPLLARIGKGLASTILSASNGLERFGKVLGGIGDAFGNVKSVRDILNSLFGDPEGTQGRFSESVFKATNRTQEFVQSLLLLGNSAGHIFRAFQEGGIRGAIDEFGNQWDRISGELSDIAHLALDIVVEVGSWLWGGISSSAGDLWGWVKQQLGLTANVQDPMLRGLEGPQTVSTGLTLFGVLVNIGSWAWGGVLDSADSLWDWLRGILGGGGRLEAFPGMGGSARMGPGVNLDNVPVNIRSWDVQDAHTVWDAIAQAIGVATTDERIEAAGLAGEEAGNKAAPKFWDSFFGAFSRDTDEDTGEKESFIAMLNRKTDVWAYIPDTRLDEWIEFGAGWGLGFVESTMQGFWSAIQGATTATDVPSNLFSGATQNQGAGAITDAVSGFFQPITDALNSGGDLIKAPIEALEAAWDDVTDALTIDFSGIPSPELPGFITGVADWLQPVFTAIGIIDQAADALIAAKNKLFGAESMGEIKVGSTVEGPDLGTGPHVAPAQQGGGGAGEGFLQSAVSQSVMMKLDINTEPAQTALDGFDTGVREWAESPIEGTLALDAIPAFNALFSIMQQANAFASRTYTARLNFSVDTSGLALAEAAARSTAQVISDLLHMSSPARTGPLHDRPPRFFGISDEFSKIADRIERDAYRAAGAISDMGGTGVRFADSASASPRRSGGNQTIQVFALKSDELTRLMKGAEGGIDFNDYMREFIS